MPQEALLHDINPLPNLVIYLYRANNKEVSLEGADPLHHIRRGWCAVLQTHGGSGSDTSALIQNNVQVHPGVLGAQNMVRAGLNRIRQLSSHLFLLVGCQIGLSEDLVRLSLLQDPLVTVTPQLALRVWDYAAVWVASSLHSLMMLEMG